MNMSIRLDAGLLGVMLSGAATGQWQQVWANKEFRAAS